MPRKRMIDPEFWSDEKIALLSPEAKLLFIGLWNYSDDEGIFKNHPALISSEIFPYENNMVDRIEKHLDRIEELNLIYRYNYNGQGYGIILNFKKHQSISHPQPSKLPRPSIQNTKYRDAIFRRDGFICNYCRMELRYVTNDRRDRPTIDHIIPQIKGGSHLPDNLVTACEKCNKGKCDTDADLFRERSGNDTGTLLPNLIQYNSIQSNNVQFDFELVWTQYPNKLGKKAAERHFFATVKTEEDWQDIQKSIANYKASDRVKKGYIQNGSTFFNNWRDWVDFKEAPKVAQNAQNRSQDGLETMIAAKLGKLATKPMIKAVLMEIPENMWWMVDRFLKKRYPGGSNGFGEVEREIKAEAEKNRGQLGNLIAGIGK